MKMKRIAIAVAAVASLASLGGVALAKTPAVGQNTPAHRRQPTTVVDADAIQAGDQTTAESGTEATSEAGGEQPTKTEGGSAPSPTDPEVMRMPRATWTISSTGRSDPSVPTEGGSGAAGHSLTPSAAGPRRRPEAKRRRIPPPLGEHRPRSGRRVPPRSRC